VIPEDATDADLVARVLGGKDAAFTALMRRHKSWLYVFIRRHTSTSEDAWDVLQDSFASAWRALKSYDPERPLDVWLRRIALNKCRDRARREAVRRRFMSLVGLPGDDRPQAADPSAAPEAVQIAGETLARLNAALEALPAHLKEPLVLMALQGLSQKEAAELLGATPKVVEMRVYRARKQLAAALDPEDFRDIEGLG
jgi:RNA polymerase sigma-70 factor (ECF subfamily)